MNQEFRAPRGDGLPEKSAWVLVRRE